ncbi:MAG: glycosyltransferase [Patescibacteria group bacterium]|nr:glycosyltransferase [Patescibacteria group bacterium]
MAIIEFLVYTAVFLALYYGAFVFLTFFENKNRIYRPSVKRRVFPFLTVILPCFNEEENIDAVLGSLCVSDYPKDKLEIIVVDDGSTDSTLAKARAFQENCPFVRVFHKENGGKYTALNLGIQNARGDFIGCVDADCFVDRFALKNTLAYLDDPEIMASVATIKIMKSKNILEGIQTAEYLGSAFLRKIASFWDSIIVTSGPLSIFRKEVFQKIGLYRQAHLTEDLEMAFRMQFNNMRIAHALEAFVYTKARPTLKSLCRQRLRWQRGFLLNLRDYKELLNFRKHGNLALFLLYCFIGAFMSMAIVSYGLFQLAKALWGGLGHLWLLQGDFSYLFPREFSWPVLHFSTGLILNIFSLALIISFLFVGKKLTFDKIKLKSKAIYYWLFYSYLATFWWVLAFYSIIFKKKLVWG